MNTENEYIKIGKAVMAEFAERGNKRGVTVILRGEQHNGKLYIGIEDGYGVLSGWDYSDLLVIRTINRARAAKERGDALAEKIRNVPIPEEPPRVVIVE